MVALPKDRELSARWQHAAELLLAEADVGAFSKQIELALFIDAKLDVGPDIGARNLSCAPTGHYLDMVGVTGSIPVAPTIDPREIRLFHDHRALTTDASSCLNKPRTLPKSPPDLGNAWAGCSRKVHCCNQLKIRRPTPRREGFAGYDSCRLSRLCGRTGVYLRRPKALVKDAS